MRTPHCSSGAFSPASYEVGFMYTCIPSVLCKICTSAKLFKRSSKLLWLVTDGSLFESMLYCCCGNLGIWMERQIIDISCFS